MSHVMWRRCAMCARWGSLINPWCTVSFSHSSLAHSPRLVRLCCSRLVSIICTYVSSSDLSRSWGRDLGTAVASVERTSKTCGEMATKKLSLSVTRETTAGNVKRWVERRQKSFFKKDEKKNGYKIAATATLKVVWSSLNSLNSFQKKWNRRACYCLCTHARTHSRHYTQTQQHHL